MEITELTNENETMRDKIKELEKTNNQRDEKIKAQEVILATKSSRTGTGNKPGEDLGEDYRPTSQNRGNKVIRITNKVTGGGSPQKTV